MTKTRAVGMLASLVAAALLVLGFPSVASADTPRIMSNIATSRCSTAIYPFPILTVACSRTDQQQQWHKHSSTYGYQIINEATGKCVMAPFPTSSDVYLVTCDSADARQQWFSSSYNGGNAIRNAVTGRCLTDQYQLVTTSCSTIFTNYQLWAW